MSLIPWTASSCDQRNGDSVSQVTHSYLSMSVDMYNVAIQIASKEVVDLLNKGFQAVSGYLVQKESSIAPVKLSVDDVFNSYMAIIKRAHNERMKEIQDQLLVIRDIEILKEKKSAKVAVISSEQEPTTNHTFINSSQRPPHRIFFETVSPQSNFDTSNTFVPQMNYQDVQKKIVYSNTPVNNSMNRTHQNSTHCSSRLDQLSYKVLTIDSRLKDLETLPSQVKYLTQKIEKINSYDKIICQLHQSVSDIQNSINTFNLETQSIKNYLSYLNQQQKTMYSYQKSQLLHKISPVVTAGNQQATNCLMPAVSSVSSTRYPTSMSNISMYNSRSMAEHSIEYRVPENQYLSNKIVQNNSSCLNKNESIDLSIDPENEHFQISSTKVASSANVSEMDSTRAAVSERFSASDLTENDQMQNDSNASSSLKHFAQSKCPSNFGNQNYISSDIEGIKNSNTCSMDGKNSSSVMKSAINTASMTHNSETNVSTPVVSGSEAVLNALQEKTVGNSTSDMELADRSIDTSNICVDSNILRSENHDKHETRKSSQEDLASISNTEMSMSVSSPTKPVKRYIQFRGKTLKNAALAYEMKNDYIHPNISINGDVNTENIELSESQNGSNLIDNHESVNIPTTDLITDSINIIVEMYDENKYFDAEAASKLLTEYSRHKIFTVAHSEESLKNASSAVSVDSLANYFVRENIVLSDDFAADLDDIFGLIFNDAIESTEGKNIPLLACVTWWMRLHFRSLCFERLPLDSSSTIFNSNRFKTPRNLLEAQKSLASLMESELSRPWLTQANCYLYRYGRKNASLFSYLGSDETALNEQLIRICIILRGISKKDADEICARIMKYGEKSSNVISFGYVVSAIINEVDNEEEAELLLAEYTLEVLQIITLNQLERWVETCELFSARLDNCERVSEQISKPSDIKLNILRNNSNIETSREIPEAEGFADTVSKLVNNSDSGRIVKNRISAEQLKTDFDQNFSECEIESIDADISEYRNYLEEEKKKIVKRRKPSITISSNADNCEGT